MSSCCTVGWGSRCVELARKNCKQSTFEYCGYPGACCYPDGACVEFIRAAQCLNAGGDFRGGHSGCFPTPGSCICGGTSLSCLPGADLLRDMTVALDDYEVLHEFTFGPDLRSQASGEDTIPVLPWPDPDRDFDFDLHDFAVLQREFTGHLFAQDIGCVELRGVITSVNDPGNLLEGGVQVGQTVYGGYSFDVTTSDSNELPFVGEYVHNRPQHRLWIGAGRHIFRRDPFDIDCVIQVVDSTEDAFIVQGRSNVRLKHDVIVEEIRWQLFDGSGTALSGTTLPFMAPALEDWTSSLLTIKGGRTGSPFEQFELTGEITDVACIRNPACEACIADSHCGDGHCAPDETCQNCAPDCGTCPPQNDTCNGAESLTVPGTTVGRADAAGVESPIGCAIAPGSQGVWYRVTGTGNMMTATTCRGLTEFDTRLSVFCNGCETPICVKANDDDCQLFDPLTSTVRWCSQDGAEYFILAHWREGESGFFVLQVSEELPCDDARLCGPDCNENGRPDVEDIATGRSDDCDHDTVPDECQPDCNTNGLNDRCELQDGSASDCNLNEVLDECELNAGGADCNGNGVPDGCDIAFGTSRDLNLNNIPDSCEGSCCLPKDTPGCSDSIVQDCVCSFDNYCCSIAWDGLCSIEAEQCGSCYGDCLVANSTPGCSDGLIELCVCSGMPDCCEVVWSAECADAAGRCDEP
ncbi:MAG: hypothetical protein V3W34_04360 [Phycisphaerae bacterium]